MKSKFDLENINSVRSIVRDALRYKKSGRALDLGCGVGRHSLFLAKKGFRVVAVDTKVEILAALKELAPLQRLPIVVQREDVVTYKPKSKFDFILSNMVLHFLPRAAQKILVATMQNATKAGGLNILSVYTHKNKRGTRPYLMHAGSLKQAYEDAGWRILSHHEGLGNPHRDLVGRHKIIRIWKEELIAQKP
jgi:tellurite methyltransferase